MCLAGSSTDSGPEDADSVEGAPVMLALSTFRKSDQAVELAIEKASKCRKLVVVYVMDVNLSRYMIGSDIGVFPRLKERYEEELLEEHRRQGEAKVESISQMARAKGISVDSHLVTGRFALECMKIVRHEKPGMIITTRSKRPKWIKKLFGSPVDYLITHAGCQVIEA